MNKRDREYLEDCYPDDLDDGASQCICGQILNNSDLDCETWEYTCPNCHHHSTEYEAAEEAYS